MTTRLGRAALDLIFPPRCAGCGRGGTFLCAGCIDSLAPAIPPRCRCCWQPTSGAERCRNCQLTPPAFDALRAAFVYRGTVRELVHALKYRGMTAVAAPMAELLAKTVRESDFDADVVVPTPLSGLRRRTRGYNQAEALAKPLARELGLPVWPRALERRRHTPPQARSADAEERRRNVAGAFRCREPAIAGQRVLLVDDVTTTGATLDACAKALREAGARSIWGFAFARED